MAAPFIFITSFAIQEGKLDGLRQSLREFFTVIEANEPRLLDVQVHPDAASLEHHQLTLFRCSSE